MRMTVTTANPQTLHTATLFVWDRLLDRSPWDGIRVLSCGCLVIMDHGMLNLYTWNSGSTASQYGGCRDEGSHALVRTLFGIAYETDTEDDGDLEQPDLLAFAQTVADYTDGWDGSDTLLEGLGIG